MFRPLLAAAAFALLSSLASAAEPSSHTDDHGNVHGDHSQAHLILAGLVSATFLVFGALAGRKGGPASRRSLRPSGRGPLQKG